MSLYFNMVYYHIQISKNASSLCTIILPWGKYRYKCLPMRVTNSPETFQQKMNHLFHGCEFIRVRIDNLLVLTKVYWTDHVHKIELNLNKWKEKGPNKILRGLYLETLKWNI